MWKKITWYYSFNEVQSSKNLRVTAPPSDISNKHTNRPNNRLINRPTNKPTKRPEYLGLRCGGSCPSSSHSCVATKTKQTQVAVIIAK